jgi:alcohol dehydrogenase class IV
MSALRGAGLIAKSLDAAAGERDPAPLALGSVLCAYALDSARFAIHHVICQSLVRTLRIPHAETNAAILPRVIEAMVPRAGKQMTALARALGTRRDRLGARIEELAGGRVRLSSLDADEALLDDTIALVLARPELELTPDPPDEQEIRSLIEAAW